MVAPALEPTWEFTGERLLGWRVMKCGSMEVLEVLNTRINVTHGPAGHGACSKEWCGCHYTRFTTEYLYWVPTEEEVRGGFYRN